MRHMLLILTFAFSMITVILYSSTNTMFNRSFTGIDKGSTPQPLWWARVYADQWEDVWSGGRPHKLAVWLLPYCHQQQYHGSGGYADTCSSSHGCIDQWTWWLRSPVSKLGVPYSWWIDPFKPDRRNIRNYSAVCWIH
jgi:hypothetical protein